MEEQLKQKAYKKKLEKLKKAILENSDDSDRSRSKSKRSKSEE